MPMKTMRISNCCFFVAASLISSAGLTATAQDYRVLHNFAGGANDGATPWGSLVQSGPALYGMTSAGGSNNVGTVFRINADGTNFQLLHSFVSATTDGAGPDGTLLLSGSLLYGMATSWNTSGGGTLFRLNTEGSGFQVLRSFSTSDGVWPWGSLIQSGSTLYGLNTYGGNAGGGNGCGTAFKFDTNGSVFEIVHLFNGSTSDGRGPHGAFLQSGPILYGTTQSGGSGNCGTVFQINTNDRSFQLLHSFSTAANDGKYPGMGALVLSGSNLFGMTSFGGGNSKGAVFRVSTNGAGFQLLHSFTGGTNGQKPFGSVILSGSTLYGMTSDENTGTDGTIFSVSTEGADFRVLHRFKGADGRDPGGDLLLSGSALYGMTSAGGSNNLGVIFALDLPWPTLAISLNNTNVALSWSTNFPDYVLESTDQLTASWTSVPGITGYSATLPVNAATNRFFRLKK
jgi:uncharacterized repeat protein (TIGR03803 family)